MSVFDEDLTPDEEARLGPTVKLMRWLAGKKPAATTASSISPSAPQAPPPAPGWKAYAPGRPSPVVGPSSALKFGSTQAPWLEHPSDYTENYRTGVLSDSDLAPREQPEPAPRPSNVGVPSALKFGSTQAPWLDQPNDYVGNYGPDGGSILLGKDLTPQPVAPSGPRSNVGVPSALRFGSKQAPWLENAADYVSEYAPDQQMLTDKGLFPDAPPRRPSNVGVPSALKLGSTQTPWLENPVDAKQGYADLRANYAPDPNWKDPNQTQMSVASIAAPPTQEPPEQPATSEPWAADAHLIEDPGGLYDQLDAAAQRVGVGKGGFQGILASMPDQSPASYRAKIAELGARAPVGGPSPAMIAQRDQLKAQDAANGRPGGFVNVMNGPAGVDQWRPDAHAYQSTLDKLAAANQTTLAKAQAMAQMEHDETGVPLAQTQGQRFIDMFKYGETRNRMSPGMSQADVAGVIDAASKHMMEANQLDEAKKAEALRKAKGEMDEKSKAQIDLGNKKLELSQKKEESLKSYRRDSLAQRVLLADKSQEGRVKMAKLKAAIRSDDREEAFNNAKDLLGIKSQQTWDRLMEEEGFKEDLMNAIQDRIDVRSHEGEAGRNQRAATANDWSNARANARFENDLNRAKLGAGLPASAEASKVGGGVVPKSKRIPPAPMPDPSEVMPSPSADATRGQTIQKQPKPEKQPSASQQVKDQDAVRKNDEILATAIAQKNGLTTPGWTDIPGQYSKTISFAQSMMEGGPGKWRDAIRAVHLLRNHSRTQEEEDELNKLVPGRVMAKPVTGGAAEAAAKLDAMHPDHPENIDQYLQAELSDNPQGD